MIIIGLFVFGSFVMPEGYSRASSSVEPLDSRQKHAGMTSFSCAFRYR